MEKNSQLVPNNRYFLVRSLVCEHPEKWETEKWTMERVLFEINRDHSDDFEDYTETDWREGWDEWVSPEYHVMIGEVNHELKKEIKLFFDDHYQNFGCYPMDFEFQGVVFNWDDCWRILGKVSDQKQLS